jgi:ABC-type transport system involved in multi-copper enzyme maturation permease subunit
MATGGADFAAMTAHIELYNNVLGYVYMEGMLLAALLGILALGLEQASHTQQSVFSTKAGRRLALHKLVAVLLATAAFYTLIAATTLALQLGLHGYPGGELGASLAAGACLAFSAALMGVAAGLLTHNIYMGFLAVAAVNAVCYGMSMVLPLESSVRQGFALTPAALWRERAFWFTDGSAEALWPGFEVQGVGVSLAVLILVCSVAMLVFKRKEIA